MDAASASARLSDEELIAIYTDQHSVERGFAFLKDPRFLASSVFLKKPERIMALSLVMVLCLLAYRLAEHRVRQRVATTGQTIPDRVKKPTNRPTMRWVFQCFEGIELLHIRHGPGAVGHVAHPAADAPAPADPRPARADLRAILRIEQLTVRTVGNGKHFVCVDRA